MTTAHTHSSGRALAAFLLIAFLNVLALTSDSAAGSASTAVGCSGSYNWPVKPFDRPHQIRGSFGDPRTVFHGPPTLDTLLSGTGRFTFHEGVDITAPDGEAVYPVASGTVFKVTDEWVGVACGNGRAFEYWHLDPRVRAGQRVIAGRTVLGTIKRSEAHVHLTQLERGFPVNPVADERLTPYEDTTVPEIREIAIRRTERGADLLPQSIGGRVFLLAEATDFAEQVDTPGLRTPSVYRNWPVAPARVTWRIERWTGKVVVRERVACDVRESVPEDARFWNTFARGTHQNQSVFGSHYSYLQPGRYLFRLTAVPFDTRTLRNGVFDLVVTAEDRVGHRDVSRLRFTVENA